MTTRAEFLEKLGQTGTLNLIFQLTDQCVLSCRYCFAKGSHKSESLRLPDKLLEAAIRSAFDTRHREVCFEWTGGEPFLAGVDFYRKVEQLQKQYATKPYSNVVQTSGYLHDRELITWLAAHGFHISSTIDGPAELHDFQRPASGGGPSLATVLATRQTIIEHQGSCGCICTITRRSLGKEGAILDFYRSLGIDAFHSNPYHYFSENLVGDENLALDAEGYAAYFIAQFNAWFEGGRKLPMPGTLNYVLRSLAAGAGLKRSVCTFGGRCLTSFLAITPDGDAWLCPKFAGFDGMRLGNVGETAIPNILDAANPAMSRLIDQRLEAMHACEAEVCRFMYLCNGGCPYYSFIASGGRSIAAKDSLCAGKQLLFEYLESVVELIDPGQLPEPQLSEHA
ncbi:MAG: radical SAM protein [Chlorobaculum sp.]